MKRTYRTLIVLLTFFSTSSFAIYNTTIIDEMTDDITYATVITSNNYGEYKHKGKAKLFVTCENGKIDSYITFPDFISSPTALHIRFDKNKMKKLKNITGSASNHGIFFGENRYWVIKNIMNASIVVLRGFSYDYISDSPYNFSLIGSSKKINLTLNKGGCLDLAKKRWAADEKQLNIEKNAIKSAEKIARKYGVTNSADIATIRYRLQLNMSVDKETLQNIGVIK